MTKLVKKPNSNSKPEWAAAVARLRHTQGQNQEAFGKKFHCSPMAVSRWERGVSQPPAQTYLEMGNMAGDPLCWYFWGRAGLSREDVMRVLPRLRNRLQRVRMPHLEIVTAGSGGKKRIQKNKLELVAIPLLKTFAASHGEVGDGEAVLVDAQIESMIAAPREWCPNPATTSCLRVRGDSMSPLIHDGYIVAVDSGQTDVADLNGKIVIAWHRDKGLTVSRLRQFDHTVVLQSENISYESITLSGKQKWKIVAKVLWWIGKAP